MPIGIYKHKPHTEDRKRKIGKALKGIKRSEKTKKKMRKRMIGNKIVLGKHWQWNKESKEKRKKEGNPNWKGNKVSYRALHFWIRENLGIPHKCKFCKITDKEKKIQWANKSGEYTRYSNDWIPLCVKCHRKYDKQKLKN